MDNNTVTAVLTALANGASAMARASMGEQFNAQPDRVNWYMALYIYLYARIKLYLAGNAQEENSLDYFIQDPSRHAVFLTLSLTRHGVERDALVLNLAARLLDPLPSFSR